MGGRLRFGEGLVDGRKQGRGGGEREVNRVENTGAMSLLVRLFVFVSLGWFRGDALPPVCA